MNKKLTIKNIISSLMVQVVAIICGFIIPKLLLQTYGSNTYGMVASITKFLAYIVLLESGIGPVIKSQLFKPIVENNTQKINKILYSSEKFFRRIAYVFIIYVILLCIVYPIFINESFNALFTISLIVIISVSRFFEYFFGLTYKLYLCAEQKNYIDSVLNIITHIINLICIVILIKFDFNIQLVKLISSMIFIVRPLILKMYVKKKYNIVFDSNEKEFQFSQKFNGFAHHIASVVQDNVDIVLLTIFSSLSEVSVYSIYCLVTNGIRSLVVAMTNGMDAFFGKMLLKESKDKINHTFDVYSYIFYTITTIIVGTTLVLIIPFVSVYTSGITDANYIRPIFAIIIVLSEYIYLIRYPFSTIVYAAGHFKQTSWFSILEPIINIIISFTCIINFGIIGVAIGTLLSMGIRTFGFVFYGIKNILNDKVLRKLRMIIVSFCEILVILFVYLNLTNILVTTYMDLLKLGFVTFFCITIFVLVINGFAFRNQFKSIVKLIKLKRKV